MSEVNGPKFSVKQCTYKGTQKQNQEPAPEPVDPGKQQLTDFSNMQAEALGRSMLFKGADNINTDLKALMEDPQIAENSDKAFETAYKIAQDNGAENPYEEAATFSTTSF